MSLLTACSRPMTDGEIAYGNELFTRGLNFEEVRFSGQERQGIQKAKEKLAQEHASVLSNQKDSEKLISAIPSLFGADAIVIGNTIYFDSDVYSLDFSESVADSDRWLMAHELTHVWQWQNRDYTGYTFSRVVSEHVEFGDSVYKYILVDGKRFTDYRFEQQGAIVQCYAMLRQVRPNAPVTLKHERIIRSEFPLDALLKLIGFDDDGIVRVRKDVALDTCFG